MEHDCPLYQGKVGPFSEGPLVAEVVNVMCVELIPLAPLDGNVFNLRLQTKLDEVSDCRQRLPNDLRD